MPEANPFAGLVVTTPDQLAAKRAAELAVQNQDPDLGYWSRSAGRSGLDLRNRLIEQGRNLSTEDRRALANQTILKNAQSNLAELVKNGSLDPMDAQELVINKAMTEFMSVGDYQAAQALIPQLNAVRSYKEELAKLKSETFENQATGRKAMIEGSAAAEKLPFEEKLLMSQSGAQQSASMASRANAIESLAHADLYNRTDPNKTKATSLSSKIGIAEQAKVRSQMTGTLNLMDRMNDLSLYMDRAARAASAVGQSVNTVNQYLAGFSNAMQASGSTKGGYDQLDPAAKAIVAPRRVEMIKKARTLGMDVTAYESIVIDAAYALARANDPGGRLSNNDFDYALKSLGAVQDVASAKAAFAAIAERAHDNFKNLRRGYDKEDFDTLFGDGAAEVDAGYQAFRDKWGTTLIRQGGGPRDRIGPAPAKNLDSEINRILGQ